MNLKKNIDLDETDYKLATTGYGWGAYHIIRVWLTEDLDRTPDQITDLFIKLAGGSVYM